MGLSINKIIYHFHYEGNVLSASLDVAHGISGFRGKQFETASLIRYALAC